MRWCSAAKASLAAYAILIGGAVSVFAQSAQAPKLADTVTAFRSAIGDTYSVTLLVDHGEQGEQFQYQRMGDFGLAHNTDLARVETATLLNPDYFAIIRRRPGGEWEVFSVVIAGTPEFSSAVENFSANNVFLNNLVELRGAGFLIENPDFVIEGSPEALNRPHNEDWSVELVVRNDLPRGRVGSFLSGQAITVTAEPDADSFIRVYTDVPDGPRIEAVYSDVRAIRSTDYPTRIKIYRDGDLIQEQIYDFDRIDDALDRDLCYLSHYGISEPRLPLKPTWIIVATACGAILIVAVLVLRRRNN